MGVTITVLVKTDRRDFSGVWTGEDFRLGIVEKLYGCRYMFNVLIGLSMRMSYKAYIFSEAGSCASKQTFKIWNYTGNMLLVLVFQNANSKTLCRLVWR